MDEAVARAAELSAASAADVSALAGVGDDVDQMVEEMEALRLALEEMAGAARPDTARGRRRHRRPSYSGRPAR